MVLLCPLTYNGQSITLELLPPHGPQHTPRLHTLPFTPTITIPMSSSASNISPKSRAKYELSDAKVLLTTSYYKLELTKQEVLRTAGIKASVGESYGRLLGADPKSSRSGPRSTMRRKWISRKRWRRWKALSGRWLGFVCWLGIDYLCWLQRRGSWLIGGGIN